jgi:hypothetical protein
MIRSAHLLCAIVLTGACFACAPLPPVPPSPVTITWATCPNDGSSFGNHLAVITLTNPPYNPDPNFGTPPGTFPNPNQLTTQEQTDLNNAFMAAPPRFQKTLCTLSGIYIDSSATYSWGFRDPNTQQNRYIGLSQQSLWGNGNSSPLKYSSSETNLIQQVLATNGASWTNAPTPPPPPIFSAATPVDTPAMTVLAALAHEYGHILWYDLIKGNNKLSYTPASFCRSSGKKGFFDNSWSSVSVPDRFVTFAAPPPSGNNHLGNIQTPNLISAINTGTWTTPEGDGAVDYLNKYFTPYSSSNNRNGVWPSVFGSISPPEDFVETFKIYIMTRPGANGGAPVTSMPLNLYTTSGASPTYSPDIYQEIAQGGQHERKRKMDCIDGKWAALVH